MKAFLVKLAFKAFKDSLLPMVFELVNKKVDELGKDLVDDKDSPVTLDTLPVVEKKLRKKAEETLDEIFSRFE